MLLVANIFQNISEKEKDKLFRSFKLKLNTDLMDMSLNKLGDSEGQGNLVCCSPWGHKELDTT